MNLEDNFRKVVPYVPGEQPRTKDVIKLNTNENPYGPTPLVREVLSGLKNDYDHYRLYPPVDAGKLARELARYYVQDENTIFVGVGSDDVLATAFLTCFNSGKPVLFPDITYSFYDVWADLYKIPYEMIPLDDEFRLHREDYIKDNGGVVIANPNAPTSVAMSFEDIEYIVKNNQGRVVIVDEAYIDFGGESVLPLVDQYENLLVVRTFSKSRSMAGVRIGFAFGSPKIIKAMNDVKFSINSYTMNFPAIEIGCAAVKDEAYFTKQLERVVKTREKAAKDLKKLGFKVLDSSANFLFVTHKSVKASEIFKELKERKIYVRYFKKPRIDNYLRITIGTNSQMKALINALKEILPTE